MTAEGRRLKLKREGSWDRFRGSTVQRQLKYPLILLSLVLLTGVTGFMLIEGWGVLDAVYMTVLTLSTVGYKEVYPLSPQGKLFNIFLIVTGVGSVAYAIRALIQIAFEDRIRAVLGRRYMKAIQKLKNHYIICGFGRMGHVICQELDEMGYPFAVVENDPERLEELERLGYPYIRGDATVDEVLVEAGIDRAKGVVSVVTGDAENVFIVLTARGLNPKLNIVTRAASEESAQKLIRAGASKVVSVYNLGGFRIAQAVLRPTVLNFLESIVDDKSMELRLEQIDVSPTSKLVGLNLASSGIRQEYNLIILAIREATGRMIFNPPFDTEIKAGDTLVVLGQGPNLQALDAVAVVHGH